MANTTSIITVEPNAQSIAVTVTVPSGLAFTAYTTLDGSTPVTFPVTITTRTSFFFDSNHLFDVSLIGAAGENANGSGGIQPINLRSGGTAQVGYVGPVGASGFLTPGVANGTFAALATLSINVKNYGAKGDGVTDDTAAVLTALAAVPVTGGEVYFPRGIYLLNTTQSAAGLSWVLAISKDYITFRGDGPGATILRTTAAASALLFVAGAGKPTGMLNWLSYDAWRFAGDTFASGTAITPASPFTLYPIVAGAARGTMTVTTATAANAGNFAAGDYVFIRTGQVVPNASNWNAEPDGEINKVISVNAGTGVLTLERPLAKTYLQEFQSAIGQPSSTAAAAVSAPLGITKVTAATMKRFVLKDIRIESPNSMTGTVICRGIVDGFWHDNVEFDVLGTFHDCQAYRDGKFRAVRGVMRGTATGSYSALSAAVGCTDVEIDDLVAYTTGPQPCLLQLTEGASRIRARGITLTSGGGVGSGVNAQSEFALNARVRDVEISDYTISGANAYSAIAIGQSCGDGGRISSGIIRKPAMTARSIICSSPNWQIEPPVDGRGGDIQYDTFVRSTGLDLPVRILSAWVNFNTAQTAVMGVMPAQSVILSAGVYVYGSFNAATTNVLNIGTSGSPGSTAGPIDVSSAFNKPVAIGAAMGYRDTAATMQAAYTFTGAAPTAGLALAWVLIATAPTQV